jgi:hypothetical protein
LWEYKRKYEEREGGKDIMLIHNIYSKRWKVNKKKGKGETKLKSDIYLDDIHNK